MTRIYFQKPMKGDRAVRGELVRRMQLALQKAGVGPSEADGIFGGDTEKAVAEFQQKQGLPKAGGPEGCHLDQVPPKDGHPDGWKLGQVDSLTWKALTGEEEPGLLERCLQLTADFEGHGFGKAAGNFDGAGLTWGIIGFTLKHGEVQKVLIETLQGHPGLITQAFGPLEGELLAMLVQNREVQLDWADGLSLGTRKNRLERPWEAAFETLGTFPEVQAAQLWRVDRYWQVALRDAGRFDLTSDPGLALCFDLAVQNGGVDFDAEERRIRRWLAANPGATEPEKRVCLAEVVAENSRAPYVEDVRQRKRALATGEGTVHGARYRLADWGIAD